MSLPISRSAASSASGRSPLKSKFHIFSGNDKFTTFLWLFKNALIIVAVLLTIIYSYFWIYPIFCLPWRAAPTRIVFYADPQIEGDTKVARDGLHGQLTNSLNDLFQHHVVDRTRAYFLPDLIAVLGDLYSFQRTSDEEFENRYERYKWIFNWNPNVSSAPQWIHLPGNHDIGYAWEVDSKNLARFESHFGRANTFVRLPRVQLGVFNSQNVDPAENTKLQNDTWRHIEFLSELQRLGDSTLLPPLVLLTHIPFHKPAGICFDAPEIKMRGSFVRDQTMLSEQSSLRILNLTRPVLIFNGHDHTGCFFIHSFQGREIPEYTVRALQGDFEGNVAVLDIYSNADESFEYAVWQCSFVHMRVLVAILITTLVWLLLLLVYIVLYFVSIIQNRKRWKAEKAF